MNRFTSFVFRQPPSALFSPFDVQYTVETLEKTVDSIELSFKSNFKVFLAEEKLINGQLDIIIQDLQDTIQKMNFLLKTNRDPTVIQRLEGLKVITDSLNKQLAVFGHINTLRKFNLEKLTK